MRVQFLIVVMALCYSCKKSESFYSNFYFAEVQPVSIARATKIPRHYDGIYINSDQDTLYIHNNAVYFMTFEKSVISKDSLDLPNMGEYISYKTKLQSANPEIVLAREDEDSLYIKYPVRDTLFGFSENQCAKKLNGYFIVNTKDSVYWHVAAYMLKKDSLYIKRFLDKEDLGIVKSVVKEVYVNADSSQIILNPTKREFRKLLKSKAGSVQGFRKIG
jgi:hypothetical protein